MTVRALISRLGSIHPWQYECAYDRFVNTSKPRPCPYPGLDIEIVDNVASYLGVTLKPVLTEHAIDPNNVGNEFDVFYDVHPYHHWYRYNISSSFPIYFEHAAILQSSQAYRYVSANSRENRLLVSRTV